MPSAYIVLLTVALVAGWLYSRTSEGIFALAALSGLICFIWGFSCAPWSVQLLIVGVFLSWYKFYSLDKQGLS